MMEGLIKESETERLRFEGLTAKAREFQLGHDIWKDFNRMREIIGTNELVSAVPSVVESHVVGMIEQVRNAGDRLYLEPRGVAFSPARKAFVEEAVRLLERFIARHGGDAARAKLGITKEEDELVGEGFRG